MINIIVLILKKNNLKENINFIIINDLLVCGRLKSTNMPVGMKIRL